MFRSAILKLTAIYLGMVMAISLLFSAVLYHFAFQELSTALHNQYLRWQTQYQPFGLRLPLNPSDELAARSHNILMELVYLNLALLVLSGLASYLLARRTLRPIEAAHDQEKRFTADVSHELRTPLTAIKMETQVALLDKRASAAALRQTLESNLEEATHMEQLINNLLQLSSTEQHRLRDEFTALKLDDVVQAAIDVVQKQAESRSIKLSLQAVPSVAEGDTASLKQLFVILLDNAIKYSPDGSNVDIRMNQKSGHVDVAIIDHGIGIDAKALPHIFDRFYRADKARNNQASQGFGLGLSLAKLIADLHHAEITIASTVGKGTTTTVSLPTA